jgi:integrase
VLGQRWDPRCRGNEPGLHAEGKRAAQQLELNARQGFFERGEFEALLTSFGDQDLRDFVEWFYWTGMRPGEIRSLSWEGFDRETWTLRLHARDAKTGHGRVLALEGQLRRIIEQRLAKRRLDCPLIFHRAGQPVGDFRKTWADACVAAGLGHRDKADGDVEGEAHTGRYHGKLLYDLRRTAVRNMVRAGVPERVAMEISGHRTRAVFDRYNIASDRDLRDAIIKTSSYVESLPKTSKVTPIGKAER